MVIAHFAKTKATALLIIGYGIDALLFFETLHLHDGGLSFVMDEKARSWFPMLLVAWICGIILALYLTALLTQIAFHNGRAVWVRGDTLIYMSGLFVAIRRDDVAGLSTGSYGRWARDGIVITLKSGRIKIIPIGALSEAPQVVIPRLQEWLTNTGTEMQ